MKDYRAQTPATEPPVLPLSTQMRVAAEMAAPEIRGLAEMIGTEWQAEALRLEGAVSRLEADLGKAADALDVAAAALEEARFPLSAESARASARHARGQSGALSSPRKDQTK